MNPYLLVEIKPKLLLPATAPININYGYISDLMYKVSCELQIICALSAVKLVISKWEKYVSDNIKLTNKEKTYLDVAIARVERWLVEKVSVPADEANEICSNVHVVISASRWRNKYYFSSNKNNQIERHLVQRNSTGLKNTKINITEAKAIAKAAHNVAKAVHSVNSGVYFASHDSAYFSAPHTASSIFFASDAADTPDIFYQKWWAKCYPLIQKELQDKYDNLCAQIVEDI